MFEEVMRNRRADPRTIHSLSSSIARVYKTNAVPAQSNIIWSVGGCHMNQVGARSARTNSLDQPLTYFDLSRLQIWQLVSYAVTTKVINTIGYIRCGGCTRTNHVPRAASPLSVGSLTSGQSPTPLLSRLGDDLA